MAFMRGMVICLLSAFFATFSAGGSAFAQAKAATVADVVQALDVITGGRVIVRADIPFGTGNPFVVTKSSDIPGKAVTETPGLVVGDPKAPVRKLAVGMTLTESAIELAGATGVDAIVVHHPVADAASSGGVPLRGYVGLYKLAVLEAHEAFHGRHPGIGIIHGHMPFKVYIAYGGVIGNVVFIGKPLPEVKKAGDIISRLNDFADLSRERAILKTEAEERQSPMLQETNIAAAASIVSGSPDDPVATVLHVFPHTGFTPQQMRELKKEYPDINTLVMSISRVGKDHPLVATAKELGLTVIVGNSHALEIIENGIPLAYALKSLLPGVEVVVFRERMTSSPIEAIGSKMQREYGQEMAAKYLVPKKR
ncbi:MAG: Nif3-like dinuclear metal center hexameric protein [Syntrophorhabdales bacterium]|jgi:hypothetical protein